jgi:hypothetical protein
VEHPARRRHHGERAAGLRVRRDGPHEHTK